MAEQPVNNGPYSHEAFMSLANVSLPPKLIATAGPEQYRRMLAEIEEGQERIVYPGLLELTPTRRMWINSLTQEASDRVAEAITPARLLVSMCAYPLIHLSDNTRYDSPEGRGSQADRFVGRLHWPWPKGPIQGMRHAFQCSRALHERAKNAIASAAAYTVMPAAHRSDRVIRRMQEQHIFAPIVVYPELRDKDGNLKNFSPLGTWATVAAQITPESINQVADGDFLRFIGSLPLQGIPCVIPDGHHLLRAAKATGQPWERMLQAVESSGQVFLAGGHVAAGRVDCKEADRRQESQEELRILLSDDVAAIGRTALGEIVAATYAIWRHQIRHFDATLGCNRIISNEAHLQRALAEVHRQRAGKQQHPQIQEAKQASAHEQRVPIDAIRSHPALPLTIEVPHMGIEAARGTKLEWQDHISIMRHLGQIIAAYVEELPRAV